MNRFFTIIIFLLLAQNATSQTLHALLFINENEPGREKDRRENMKNMKSFFSDVSTQIEYTFDLSASSPSDFTAAKIDERINALEIKNNDVVVFYYSGHGYNQGTDQWPTLNLLDKNYWLSDILKRLNNKCRSAKLVLCIADCCNKGMADAKLLTETFNPISPDNMKDLFTSFSGKKTIIMSSSKQGQYSYSYVDKGAFFGIALRSSIYRCSDNSNAHPTWEQVTDLARKNTMKISSNRQEPQFKILTAANPFEN